MEEWICGVFVETLRAFGCGLRRWKVEEGGKRSKRKSSQEGNQV
jgi:hypothetical protein